MQYPVENLVFFVRGNFYGLTETASLLQWLKEYSPRAIEKWATQVDGDFNLVVWDRHARTATAISDRVGAHRLYVHCSNGVAIFSNRLFDQVRLQKAPDFSDIGVYTLLTLCYPMDPYSVLRDTFVVALGDVAICSEGGVSLSSYYTPVQLDTKNFRSVHECVTNLDTAFREVVATRLCRNTTPLVMLSGGIDSVAMLCYLSELAPERIETLTFSVEGLVPNELEEARIAAQYYRSKHHELVIPQAQINELTRRALLESDTSGYGGFLGVAIADWLRKDGRWIDVFRGEDTRLHTPSLDLPALIGLLAHKYGLNRSMFGTKAWNLRNIMTIWPFRKGRNYIRYFLDKTNLRPDIRRYVLESLARYHFPKECSVIHLFPEELDQKTQELCQCDSLERLYRRLVSFEYRVQYTEDMHSAQNASETGEISLIMPFYAPNVVAVCNRIPLTIGLIPVLVSPARTRSSIPVSDKYILRKLMKGRVPDALLYRRKATAPAMHILYKLAGPATLLPTIRSWGEILIDRLSGETRLIANAYRKAILEKGTACGEDWHLGWAGCTLFFLSGLGRLFEDPSVDLLEELDTLAPWQDLHSCS